jgi:hypothetical protein
MRSRKDLPPLLPPPGSSSAPNESQARHLVALARAPAAPGYHPVAMHGGVASLMGTGVAPQPSSAVSLPVHQGHISSQPGMLPAQHDLIGSSAQFTAPVSPQMPASTQSALPGVPSVHLPVRTDTFGMCPCPNLRQAWLSSSLGACARTSYTTVMMFLLQALRTLHSPRLLRTAHQQQHSNCMIPFAAAKPRLHSSESLTILTPQELLSHLAAELWQASMQPLVHAALHRLPPKCTPPWVQGT